MRCRELCRGAAPCQTQSFPLCASPAEASLRGAALSEQTPLSSGRGEEKQDFVLLPWTDDAAW